MPHENHHLCSSSFNDSLSHGSNLTLSTRWQVADSALVATLGLRWLWQVAPLSWLEEARI
jgi:hypothetical protein